MTDVALRTTRSRWRRLGDRMAVPLWLLVAGLAAAQAIIWVEPTSPSLAVLEQFAVQLSLGAMVGVVIAIGARRWAALPVLAVLATTFAWPVLAWPFMAPHTATPIANLGPDRLLVLSANLWVRANGHQRTLDTLMASDADIIGLVEVSPEWREPLAPLIAKYPYRVDCFAIDPVCQTMLLSKLPIVRPEAGRIWRRAPIVAGGDIVWNGRTITVYAVHLTRPLERAWRDDPDQMALRGTPANRQAEQLDTLAKFVNSQSQDVIVMGDFNAAPWSRVHRAFRSVTHLQSLAGWTFTWPAWMPPLLQLPIDHILSRGHLVVTYFATAQQTDSDHLPVIAEIGWRD